MFLLSLIHSFPLRDCKQSLAGGGQMAKFKLYRYENFVDVRAGILEENHAIRNGSNDIPVKKRLVYKATKRLLDFVISALLLVLLSPLFLIVAIIIKCTSKGHVFYTQKRVGMDGKELHLYKFRSMVDGADEMIDSFTPEQKAEYMENYKLAHDPRITRFGHFLRKLSIDELPQLLNIFKGEMSFIGPRPVVMSELERYGKYKELFLSAKPGLTGYWAVNGRSATSYEDRMRLELYYVEHASLWLDAKIFFKTFTVVLYHEGAY